MNGEYVLMVVPLRANIPPEPLNIIEERDAGISELFGEYTTRGLPEYPVGDGEGDSKNL